MPLATSLQLELPRRVVVYYLLFCLIAVLWLAVGVIWVARGVIKSHTEGTLLSLLSKASSRIEIDYARHGDQNLQKVVEQIRLERSLDYCAIVSPENKYVAHSTSQHIGQQAIDPQGARTRWGQIETIGFTGGSRRLREYRIPLKNQDQTFASLRVAVREPDLFGVILSNAEFIPIAFLGPIALLAIGGVVIGRMVTPMADVESQLRRLATASTTDEVSLHEVPVRGPVALGWNRLIGQRNGNSPNGDLEQRLSQALQGLRKGDGDELLNSLPDGVAVTDADGRVTFANRAFYGLTGRDADEQSVKGSGVEACFDLEAAQPSNAFGPVSRGRSVVAELTKKGGNGERALRIARHPIRSSNRQSHGRNIWLVRDVTQHKLADKMRDEFLDAATHELRTPLSNIKAYAETLALSDALEIEQQKEFCNTINTEATRLARLVDDLLSISSLESGSLVVTRKKVEVDRMLRDVIAKVQGWMDQKSIVFEIALSDKLPELKLDKDKISTTLVNLLGNAAKYTPEGGRVAFRAHVADGELVIDVEDTGIGIAESELPRLFDKFFRSSDQRVQEETGTGLGLSLAYEVVRLHSGKLTVTSELNKGSKFSISLPLIGEEISAGA